MRILLIVHKVFCMPLHCHRPSPLSPSFFFGPDCLFPLSRSQHARNRHANERLRQRTQLDRPTAALRPWNDNKNCQLKRGSEREREKERTNRSPNQNIQQKLNKSIEIDIQQHLIQNSYEISNIFIRKKTR